MLLLSVLMATALAGLGWQLARPWRVWRSSAEALGLRMRPGLRLQPVLVGTVDGVAVRIEPHSARVDIDLHLDDILPRALRITPEGTGTQVARALGGQDLQIGDPVLDAALHIQAADPDEALRILRAPAVRERLHAVCDVGAFWVRRGRVHLDGAFARPADVRRVLTRGLRLAEALVVARYGPWSAVAEQHGLSWSAADGVGTLSGMVGAVAVTGTMRLSEDAATLTLTLPTAPLPGLTAQAGAAPGAVQTRNPILDGMLSLTGDSADAVRALAADPALSGDLLSVLHALPGSRLDGATLTVALHGAVPADLAEHADNALRLMQRLRRVSRSLAAPRAVLQTVGQQ